MRVVLTENHTQTLLVAPILLKVLLTALPLPQTVVGTVTVLYPEIAPPASKGEEYSIHEQLYQPAPESSPSRTTTFDLHSAGDSYVYMLVPYFEDAVVYHLIAEELAASWHPARVVAMAPAYMNNNQSLGKLVSSKVFASPLLDEVAALTPPLCFTGPAAAVTAAFSNTPTLALVLNAEGNSGFEKISPDTMIDACLVVASVMGLDALASTAYMRTVSTAVRKSFGGVSSSSGMYL